MNMNQNIIRPKTETQESIFLEALWECFFFDGKIQPLGWILFATVIIMSVLLAIVGYQLVKLEHILDTLSTAMPTP